MGALEYAWYANESFIKDAEIGKLAVQQNGMALKYADESLQEDPEIVKLAYQQHATALEYADESLKKDCDFLKLSWVPSGMPGKEACSDKSRACQHHFLGLLFVALGSLASIDDL